MVATKEAQERFWEKVAISDEEGACWEWTGGSSLHFRMGGRGSAVVGVRRAAYEFTYGTSPTSKAHITSTCKNERCCNPKHLIYRAKGRAKIQGSTGRTRFSKKERALMRRQLEGGMSFLDLRDQWDANASVLLKIIK